MAPAGQPVKEGDPIFNSIPAPPSSNCQQKDAAFVQAQATSTNRLPRPTSPPSRIRAISPTRNFNVEKARLQASKTEIVSRSKARKQDRSGSRQQETEGRRSYVDLHAVADKSKLASLTACAIRPKPMST